MKPGSRIARRFLTYLFMIGVTHPSRAAVDPPATQPAAATQPLPTTRAIPMRPAVLPGNGLAQHSFLYTGEWDHRFAVQTIFVVRGGKVVWTYQIPIKDPSGTLEELGDARMLANGNILFCRKVERDHAG